MIIIACVDDKMGMCFNNRRQSQDRLLRRRLLGIASGGVLRMNGYSARQFEPEYAESISAAENFADLAGAGDYCFFENQSPKKYADAAEKLILFRWNRRYPGDMFFDIDLSGWRLESASDFPGSSHEKITEEVYIK